MLMIKSTVVALYVNWYNERFVLKPIERIPKIYINNVLFTDVETISLIIKWLL